MSEEELGAEEVTGNLFGTTEQRDHGENGPCNLSINLLKFSTDYSVMQVQGRYTEVHI